MKPDYSEEELLKAKRQISSILHKLRETVRTLREKENADRLKSQITLAERRIQALEIANALIEKARGWRIWRLAEHPEMAEEAAAWFSSKWAFPSRPIGRACTRAPVPGQRPGGVLREMRLGAPRRGKRVDGGPIRLYGASALLQ